MSYEIDTGLVRPSDRFPLWRETISRCFSPADTLPLEPPENFTARMRRVALGDVEVSEIQASPICSVRDAAMLRQRPDDSFFVSCALEQEARMEQGGRRAVQREGDLLLYGSAQPFRYEFLKPYRLLVVKLPRSLLQSALPRADDLTAIPIHRGSALGSIASSLVREVGGLDTVLSTHLARKMGNTLVDILAAAFDASLRSADDGPSQRVLRRAQALMLGFLDDPDFDLDRAAALVSVSPRTLFRAFAHAQTTPMRWLWGERLALAHRLLSDRKEGQVAEIALSCGFSDFSQFSRSFRRAYGMRPSDWLKRR